MGNKQSLPKIKRRRKAHRKDEEVADVAPATSPSNQDSASASASTRVRALYAFEKRNDGDLNFIVGDIMLVFNHQEGQTWWFARNLRTLEEGHIPHNYVAIDDGRPTSLDAWFDISRREADKNLLLPGNCSGTYIIRPSSDPRHFALSMRHYDASRDMWVVKHYKIRTLDNYSGYFINSQMRFTNIQELIIHYSRENTGLCCSLAQPCPRTYRPPLQFRDIEVNRGSILRLKKLGSGSFGDVWLCRWNNSVEVAVKTLKPNSMDKDKFIKEAELLHKLYHPRIVAIMGVCTQPAEDEVLIITELMDKGSLYNFLHEEEGHLLSIKDMIDMMAQITEGMSYLEAQNFIHRDLRAANILVSTGNLVKVADFGLADVMQDEKAGAYYGTKFPFRWTAPEAALEQKFSVKSDVWSFGILMYEIVTFGREPYHGMSKVEVLEKTRRGYRMPNPVGGFVLCPDELYDIMTMCWKERPQDRPTFKHLSEVFDEWIVATEGQYLTENA